MSLHARIKTDLQNELHRLESQDVLNDYNFAFSTYQSLVSKFSQRSALVFTGAFICVSRKSGVRPTP